MGFEEGKEIRDLVKLNKKYQMGLDQQLWAAKHNKYTPGFKPQTTTTTATIQKYVDTAGTVGDLSPTRVARTPTSAKKIMNKKAGYDERRDFDKYGNRVRR